MHVKYCAYRRCRKRFETKWDNKRYCSNMCNELALGKKKYETDSKGKKIKIITMCNGMEYLDNIITKSISKRNDFGITKRKVGVNVSPISLHFKHKKFAAA